MKELIAKLRYMARQYTAGSYARGGNPQSKHYLDEAADAIERLEAECARLHRDVERYQWLKAATATEQEIFIACCPATMTTLQIVVLPPARR